MKLGRVVRGVTSRMEVSRMVDDGGGVDGGVRIGSCDGVGVR